MPDSKLIVNMLEEALVKAYTEAGAEKEENIFRIKLPSKVEQFPRNPAFNWYCAPPGWSGHLNICEATRSDYCFAFFFEEEDANKLTVPVGAGGLLDISCQGMTLMMGAMEIQQSRMEALNQYTSARQ